MKYSYLILIALIVLAGAYFGVRQFQKANFLTIAPGMEKAVVYKSPTCGCCQNYVSYLSGLGFDVEVVNTNDMDAIKAKYGVPSDLESCHTTIIGDYFVEGHVPGEAIQKLMSELPSIKGIAMPGMPSGSPGMPGAKTGAFKISAVSDEGSAFFTSI